MCDLLQVALMRSSNVQQFGALAQQVASPNPLVLAALKHQQQQEGQQRKQGQSGPAAAAAAGHDSSSMGSTESSAAAPNATGAGAAAAAAGAEPSASASATNPDPAAASATATMGGGGGPVEVASPSHAAEVDGSPAGSVDESGLDGPEKGLKMATHLDHMRLCTVLVAMMVFDVLTPMQKANWVVASYPW